MRRSIGSVQLLALVAVCLCVLVPSVFAQECPELIGSTWWWWSPGANDVIAVSDRYVCVAVSHPWWYSHGRFSVFDAHALTDPVEVNSLEIEWVKDIAVSGEYAYTVVGDHSGEDDGDLIVIDVSDPNAPLEVTSVPTVGNPRRVVLSGDRAFVVAGNEWLQVFDISDPVAPIEVAVFDPLWQSPYFETHLNSISVVGDYAYVTANLGPSPETGLFLIVDVNDAATPTRVGYTELLGGRRGGEVAVHGGYAYVTTTGCALNVIDVRDPFEPVVVGHSDLDGEDCRVAASRRLVYLVDGRDTLRVLDVSDPSEPTEVSVVDSGGFYSFLDIALSGRRLYTTGRGGFQVFDIRDCVYRKMMPAVD